MLIVMLEFVPMFTDRKYFLKNVMYSISHITLKNGNEQGGGEEGLSLQFGLQDGVPSVT